jgi:carbonic anhydrase
VKNHRIVSLPLLLGLACLAAQASPPGAAASAPSARGTVTSEPAASAASAASAPTDLMETLQQRLAAKLGAPRQDASNGELLLRVPSRTEVKQARRGGARGADAHPAHEGPPHWSYEGGAGPAAWAKLNPEFARCATGARQSPIDIRDGIKVQLDPVEFDYKPTPFRVIDNGHTVQVNVDPGNTISVLGRRYELVQFHFHRPSEERVNGKRFDMVVHLVHKDESGRLAVVAVLLEQGGAQPVVQTVWNNLPLEKGEEQAARTPIDLNRLLPEQRGYYTYMGSLTTPPCSEGVLWMVMKQPVGIAAEQIDIFSRLYPMNARPVQPTSGRMIKESN